MKSMSWQFHFYFFGFQFEMSGDKGSSPSPKCLPTRDGSLKSGDGMRGKGKGKLTANQEEGDDL